MEQEPLFAPSSPRQVRRQLCFVTPSKKMKMFDPRTEEIQKTPKCKLSKAKVIEKISKNKVIIDFNIEKNYFLDDIDTNAYFQGGERDPYELKLEQMLFGPNPNFHFTSPLQTARKPKVNSANINSFSSVAKESRRGSNFGESPFCRLLNESDQFTVDKYQVLSGGDEHDDNDERLRHKFVHQIELMDKFFSYFQQRSSGIMDLFVQEPIFEILGEENIHPLNVTLNALAKVFSNFECEPGTIEYDYKFHASDDDNEIILSTSGKLVSRDFQPDFVLSAKISLCENLIKYVKLRLC